MSTNIKLEAEAYKSLVDLLEQAEKTRLLFDRARVPLPDALARLVRSNGHTLASIQVTQAPFRPPTPPEFEADWIWVELKNATPGTVALATLKASASLLTAREVHEKVRALGIDVSVGTIANTGTRAFENGVIGRTLDAQWQLLKPEKVAVLYNEYLWGKPECFQMQEIASYRRSAVVHLLRQNPVGLQITQIVAELRHRELILPEIPSNKSLIKTDLEAMDGQRVRRRGNSKKWEAIQ